MSVRKDPIRCVLLSVLPIKLYVIIVCGSKFGISNNSSITGIIDVVVALFINKIKPDEIPFTPAGPVYPVSPVSPV